MPLCVSLVLFFGTPLLSGSRVPEVKVLVFWTRPVCRAFRCLALPCLPSLGEFCVAVERAFDCLSPQCLVFSLLFCVAVPRDSNVSRFCVGM